MPSSPLKPRLSSMIECIEVNLTLLGRTVRVVVTADALQTAFGAGAAPESWLTAAVENGKAIEQAAKIASAKSGRTTVVLQRV